MDGITADPTSEADSQEYYNSLNQHDDADGEVDYGDTTATLIGAYLASPPSKKWRQEKEKQSRSQAQAEVDEKVEEKDDEERTREMLAELRTPPDEQPATAVHAEQSAAGQHRQQRPAATKAAKGRAQKQVEQTSEAVASVGKRVADSLLATSSSSNNSGSRPRKPSSSKSDTVNSKHKRSDRRDDGAQREEQKEVEGDQFDRDTTHATVQHRQTVAVASDADPFAFGGEQMVDDDEQQQSAPANKANKAAVLSVTKKTNKKKAVRGSNKATKKAVAEQHKEQHEMDDAVLNEPVARTAQRSTEHASPPKSSSRGASATVHRVQKASVAKAAVQQAEQDSHIFSFPSAAAEQPNQPQPNRPAAAKKKRKASAGKNKGSVSQRAQNDAATTETAAKVDVVVDEMVDGGDVAADTTADASATHLDGWTVASPQSAKWHEKRAQRVQRESEQKAQKEEQPMEDVDGQPQSDAVDDGAEQPEEVMEEAVNDNEIEEQPTVQAKGRKVKKSTQSARQNKKSAVSRKTPASTNKRSKIRVEQQLTPERREPVDKQVVERETQEVLQDEQQVNDMNQQQATTDAEVEQPVTDTEEEQPQETDVYDFSSSGADEQPRTTKQKRPAAGNKRAKSAASRRGSKASKKTDATTRSSKKRKSDPAADMIDVFNATARDVGLMRDSDDGDVTRPPSAIMSPPACEEDDIMAELTILARAPKKQRAARSRARASTAAAPLDTASPSAHGPITEAALMATNTAYCEQANQEVRNIADRVVGAQKQHAMVVDSIQAELAKSIHKFNTALNAS